MGSDWARSGNQGTRRVLEFARRIRDAFPDTKLNVEDCFAAEDKVAVRWTAIGTHIGDGLGIAPTGKTVQITGMTIARFENGKIVEGWDNWDRLGMLEQIGAYTPTETALLEKTA